MLYPVDFHFLVSKNKAKKYMKEIGEQHEKSELGGRGRIKRRRKYEEEEEE